MRITELDLNGRSFIYQIDFAAVWDALDKFYLALVAVRYILYWV